MRVDGFDILFSGIITSAGAELKCPLTVPFHIVLYNLPNVKCVMAFLMSSFEVIYKKLAM